MSKVKRAIIMAAGIGQRMQPVTFDIPKPLIIVNGVRIIDTIIQALQKNGIYEIYIVVGYLKECFQNLPKEYAGVSLIYNPYYDSCNNIASLYVARDYISEAFILDGDQIIYNTDILKPEFELSGYNCVWNENDTNEWLLQEEEGYVKSCSRSGGKKGWQLFSISRWSLEDGIKLKRHLEMEFIKKNNKDVYWDDVAMFCYPNEYKLGIYPMNFQDVIEIDNFDELIMLDKHYQEYKTLSRKL